MAVAQEALDMLSSIATQALVLRPAGAHDVPALRALAELDSARLGAGPHLVAEVDGRLTAAVSLADHAVIADPFTPTEGVVRVLLARAAAEGDAARRTPLRDRLRLPRRRARATRSVVRPA